MIFDCAERYDPVTKQWAAVASLNFPRCGVGVCPCHGALYALGTHTCVFIYICITRNVLKLNYISHENQNFSQSIMGNVVP